MKRALIILVWSLLEVFGHDVSLLGSNILIPGRNYTVQFSNPNDEYSKTLVVFGNQVVNLEARSKALTFGIPKVGYDESYMLSLILVDGAKCQKDQVKLVPNLNVEYFTVIRLDKPVYQPGDNVRFIVVVLDPETRPFKYDTIDVTIFDGINDILEPSETIKRTSNYSIYSGNFVLSDDPNMGKWKINVRVNNDNKVTSKHFFVSEKSKTDKQVYMEVPSIISHLNRDIPLTVYVQDKFYKFITGTINVKAELYSSNKIRKNMKEKSIKVEGQHNTLSFSLIDDLKITNVISDLTVKFEATYEQNPSIKSYSSVVIKPLGRHRIKFDFYKSRKRFLPGSFYNFAVKVFRIDRTLEDEQGILVTARMNFTNDPSHLHSDSKVLNKGMAEFKVTTKADSQTMTLKVEIEGHTVTETIEAYEKNARILLISVDNKRPSVGENINIHVQSSHALRSVNLVVMTAQGIVFTKSFNSENLKKSFDFELITTVKMQPAANVIVYYFYEGEVILDYIKIEPNIEFRNFVKIKLPRDVQHDDKTLQITVETAENSFVSLLTVDQSVGHMGIFNDLSENDIITNMKSFMKNIYSKNVNLEALKKINLHPKKECTKEDFTIINKYLKKVKSPVTQQSTDVDYDIIDDTLVGNNELIKDNEKTEIDIDTFDSDVGNKIRSFFPDVWIYDDFITDSIETNKLYKMTDSITTWKVTGFSLHPDLGIAVAAPQHVTVHKKYSLQIQMVHTIKKGEVILVQFYLISETPFSHATIQINSDPSDLLDYIGNQYKLTSSEKNGNFNARAKKTGIVKLYFTVLINGKIVDEVKEQVKIIPNNIIIEKSETSLVDLTNSESNKKPSFTFTIPSDAKLVEAGIVISGNMFGPVIKDLIEKMPESNIGEEKLSHLNLAILAYNFLKDSNYIHEAQIALKTVKKYYNLIFKAYKEKSLFNMWPNKPSESVWFAAYIVQVLSDARDVIEMSHQSVNQIINEAYEFIQKRQDKEGFFDDKNYTNYRCVSGSANKNYLTSYVSLAFLKNKATLKASFKVSLNKAINYLKSAITTYDYDRVISSFALLIDGGNAKEEEKNFKLVEHNYASKDADNLNIGVFIEVASFETLYCLRKNNINGALKPITWLMKIREKNGGFLSTYNSAIALNAIYEYNRAIGFNTETNAQVQIMSISEIKSFNLTNKFELKEYNLKDDVTNRTVDFTFEGKGLMYCGLWYQYEVEFNNEDQKIFVTNLSIKNLNASNIKQIEIEVKLTSRVSTVPPPIVIEVSLPSGYDYQQNSILEALNVRVIDGKVIIQNNISFETPLVLRLSIFKLEEVLGTKRVYAKVYFKHKPALNDVTYAFLDEQTNKVSTNVLHQRKKREDNTPQVENLSFVIIRKAKDRQSECLAVVIKKQLRIPKSCFKVQDNEQNIDYEFLNKIGMEDQWDTTTLKFDFTPIDLHYFWEITLKDPIYLSKFKITNFKSGHHKKCIIYYYENGIKTTEIKKPPTLENNRIRIESNIKFVPGSHLFCEEDSKQYLVGIKVDKDFFLMEDVLNAEFADY